MVASSQDLAFVLAIVWTCPNLLVIPFMQRTFSVGWVIAWIRYLSPASYAWQALVQLELAGRAFDCSHSSGLRAVGILPGRVYHSWRSSGLALDWLACHGPAPCNACVQSCTIRQVKLSICIANTCSGCRRWPAGCVARPEMAPGASASSCHAQMMLAALPARYHVWMSAQTPASQHFCQPRQLRCVVRHQVSGIRMFPGPQWTSNHLALLQSAGQFANTVVGALLYSSRHVARLWP